MRRREVHLAVSADIDRACRVVVDAGSRLEYSAGEIRALDAFLRRGGSAFLLYDLASTVSPAHARWLRTLGIELTNRLVTDPVQHYAGDTEMVAATHYPSHPVVERLSFTFFPGARELKLHDSDRTRTTQAIISSSANAIAIPLTEGGASAPVTRRGARILGAAAEGLVESDERPPFRVVLIGDADFLSNSFYPYMANNRLAIAAMRWLAHEEQAAAVSARIAVTPTLAITAQTRRWLLLVFLGVIPALFALAGCLVWWRRR